MSRPDAHPTMLAGVLLVSSHSQPGGSESVLAELLETFPTGAVSGVVTLQDGALVDRLTAAGAAVTVIDTGPSLAAMVRAAGQLAKHLRLVRPRVVHGNGVKAALVSVLAARLAAVRRPVPVVWMKHDVSLDGLLGRLLARRCAAVAGVSREVLAGLGSAGRQVVVHPGVRIDTARAVGDAALLRRGLGLSGPVVTVLGRMDPAKGHAELLEALPDVLGRVPDVTAVLAGPDDPHHPAVRDRLADRVRTLGLDRRVRVLGHQPAASLIAASDVICVPTVPRPDGSGREGFGLVAAEALALGVPVVAYDAGATREVLGGCGALVPVGDRAGLACEVVRLLTDAPLRADVAARGRVRAAELTLERTVDGLLDLYEEVAR